MIRQHMTQTLAKTYRPFDGKSGTYVSVVPDDRSVIKLCEWARKLGYWLDEAAIEELHSTIVYSKVAALSPEYDTGVQLTARLERFEFWPGHDDEGYLVAVLHSPALVKLHQEWLSKGAVHAFPEYTPHITLVEGLQPNPMLYERMVRLTDRARGTLLTLGNQQIENIKAG
jgi:hypothetical protein